MSTDREVHNDYHTASDGTRLCTIQIPKTFNVTDKLVFKEEFFEAAFCSLTALDKVELESFSASLKYARKEAKDKYHNTGNVDYLRNYNDLCELHLALADELEYRAKLEARFSMLRNNRNNRNNNQGDK